MFVIQRVLEVEGKLTLLDQHLHGRIGEIRGHKQGFAGFIESERRGPSRTF